MEALVHKRQQKVRYIYGKECKQLTVLLPKDLYDELVVVSSTKSVGISSLVRTALREWIDFQKI